MSPAPAHQPASRRLSLLALALLLLALASPGHAQNLVTNHDFGANAADFTVFPGYLGGGGINPATIPGWTVGGTSGQSGINGTATGLASSPFAPATNVPHFHLMQYDRTLAQEINTTPGQLYLFSFAAAQRNNAGGNQAGLTVFADNTGPAAVALTNAGAPWLSKAAFQNYAFAFTGAGTQTIQFNSSGVGDHTSNIDSVSVTSVPGPIILPDSTTFFTETSGTHAHNFLLQGNNHTFYQQPGSPTYTGNISTDGSGGTFAVNMFGNQAGAANLTFSGSDIALGDKIFLFRSAVGGNVDSLAHANSQRLTLHNSTLTTANDIHVTRGTLHLTGSTSVTAGGQLVPVSSDPGTQGQFAWNNFVIQDSATLNVAGGIDFSNIASNLAFNGGTVITPSIWGNVHGGTSVTFNGSQIIASQDNADFLRVSTSGDKQPYSSPAQLTAAGLILNTNGFNVGINANLAGTNGTLVVQGAGTLSLTGNNSYTGLTRIEQGSTLNVASLANYGSNSSIGNRSLAQETATGDGIGLWFRGGTLQYTGSTPQSTDRHMRISTAGAIIDASGSNPGATLSFTQSGSNINYFETPGARTLTLTGSNTGDNLYALQIINQGGSPTSLTKTGSGHWIISSAASNHTGPTTVNGGTLTMTGNRTAGSGAINVGHAAADATLNIQNGSFTVGGNFDVGRNNAGFSAVVNQSAGSLTLSGNQLIVGNGSSGSSGVYNLSGGTLNGAASGNRGVILGVNDGTTGTFNLSGTGNLNLAGANLQIARSENTQTANATGVFNQTGGTATVGTLGIGGLNATQNAGNSGTLSLTGGTFTASAFNALSGGNNSTSDILIGGTANVTLPAFPTARGAGATATITFDGGTLSPFAASTNYLSGMTNAFLTANGATFNVAVGNDITIAQRFEDAPGEAGSLVKLGGGTLSLTATDSSYSGLTRIEGGILNVASLANYGSNSSIGNRSLSDETATGDGIGLWFRGGTLQYTGSTPQSTDRHMRISTAGATIDASGSNPGATLSFTQSGSNINYFETPGARTLTLTGSNTGNNLYALQIINQGGNPTSLVKSGAGLWVISGNSNYSGGTTITGGSLRAGHTNALGTGPISVADNSNLLLWWNSSNSTVPGDITLNGLGGPAPGGAKTAVYADGGGAGHREYTLAGTVTLNATSNLGGHNINDLRVSGQITGPGGLVKGGGRTDENSTLVLANPLNNYAGDTSITKGRVLLAASEVIPHGAGAGGVSVAGGTSLDLGGYSETINSLSGSGTVTSTASIASPVFFTDDAGTGLSAANTYTHAINFNSAPGTTVNGVTFDNAGAWSLGGAGGATGNANTGVPGTDIHNVLTNFNFGGNPALLTLTGLTPGQTYEARLFQRQWGGDRTQLFTLASGAQSAVMVYDQDASATPSYLAFRYTADASGTATIQTNQLGAGTYHWYGATNQVVDAPTLTVGDALNSEFSGEITSNLSLVKQGDGALTLSGANTYTGDTTVAGGALLVNGSIIPASGSSSLTVASGATLGGNGQIGSAANPVAVSINSGGILAPGNSPDTLTLFGDLTLNAGSIFDVDLAFGGFAGAGNGTIGTDRLVVDGGINLDGALLTGTWGGTNANILSGSPSDANRLWLMLNQGTDPIGGTFANTTPGGGFAGLFNDPLANPYLATIDGQLFALFYDADFATSSFSGGNDLLMTAIPEPSRALLLALALGSLLLRRRR